MARRHQGGIAPAPPAAFGGNEALVEINKVGDHRAVWLAHHGPCRHRQHQILATLAVAVIALPVGAVGGDTVRAAEVVEQAAHLRIRPKHDVASPTARAPRRLAPRLAGHPGEGSHAGTAIAAA